MRKSSFAEQGQTLVEVMIALGAAILIITSLVAGVATAVRNTRFSKNQALATKYAQEGMEEVRIYRDQNDWDTFKSELNCEDPPDLETLPPPFNRVIDCHLEEEEKMKVAVTVSWTEGRRTHKSELTTYLTKWK